MEDVILGEYGIAIAVIGGAVFIIRFLTGLGITAIAAWRETRKETVAIEQRRAEIEAKQVEAQERIATMIENFDMRSRANDQQTHDLILAARRDQQTAQGANLQLLGELKQEIKRMPTLTAEEVQLRITPLFDKAQQQITDAATNLLSANAQIEQVALLLRARVNEHDGQKIKASPEPEPGEKPEGLQHGS